MHIKLPYYIHFKSETFVYHIHWVPTRLIIKLVQCFGGKGHYLKKNFFLILKSHTACSSSLFRGENGEC